MAKRVIYSIFVEPEFDEKKAGLNLNFFSKYEKRLTDVKKNYAKKVGADWKIFKSLKKVEQFQKKFSIDTIYNAVNLYKLYMFEELSKKYDEVLYLDFDVVPNTEENFFEEVDLSKGIWALDQNDRINERLWIQHRDSRDPTLKYLHAKALTGKEHNTINTAILGGDSENIARCAFMSRLKGYIHSTNTKKGCNKYGISNEVNHNNEAFFSAAVVDSGVAIQNEDRLWHVRLDDASVIDQRTKEKFDLETQFRDAKFLHFINKNFGEYFEDVRKVVYSMNIVIPKELNDPAGTYFDDKIDKTERTTIEFAKWSDRLIANKKAYAQKIGADFIHFERDEKYEAFREDCKRVVPDMSEYNIVNFYKIWLAYYLVDEGYDQVLYLDHDVVVNTPISFFAAFNLEMAICCNYASELRDEATERVLALPRTHPENFVYNFRGHDAKYWNCHALLEEDGEDGKNDVYNTGILGASRATLEKLDYFSNFEELLETMTFLKEDDLTMYPPQVQKSFGYDNETVFSYRVQSNQVPVYNLDTQYWHYKIDHEHTGKKETVLEDDPAFMHVINKDFKLVDHAL